MENEIVKPNHENVKFDQLLFRVKIFFKGNKLNENI